MATYRITHGTFIKGGKALGVGEALELSEAEKKHLDSDGKQLVTEAAYSKMQAKVKIDEELAADEAPKPEAPKPAEVTKFKK